MEKRIAALEKRVSALEKEGNGKTSKRTVGKTKKKPNKFIQMVAEAKKKNKKEFTYNGTTYYAHPHPIFKTVFKKDKP